MVTTKAADPVTSRTRHTGYAFEVSQDPDGGRFSGDDYREDRQVSKRRAFEQAIEPVTTGERKQDEPPGLLDDKTGLFE